MIIHNISPVYNQNSKVLILGSFPSVKSRETNFFYGHPQNRFWKIIAKITNEELPCTVENKKSLLINYRIAVWDVVHSCEITGSDDNSISNVVPNDLNNILNYSDIEKIFCNGATSYKLYNKFIKYKTDMDAIKLPSTSPANAAFSFDRLYEQWRIIKDYI